MLTHSIAPFLAQSIPTMQRPINWQHPTMLWRGEKGDLSWVFAIVFATIIMMLGVALLAGTARAFRVPKPEAVRPAAGPPTSA
jgi:hypothetical protein